MGVPHTFTATVQSTAFANPTEAQWEAVSDLTTLTAAASGSGTLDQASSCLTTGTANDGTCQFIVHDAGPGTLTLTVTAIASTSVDAVIFTDIPLIAPAASSKTWIAYLVTISPSATNPVGTQHDFTITATVTDGESTDPAVGVSIAYTLSGAGSLVTPSPCTTSEAGTCTVSVTSTLSGTGTVTVTSLTDSAERVVDLSTAEAPGQATDQTVPLTASKTWLQYRVLLSPNATNLVGVPHTFTATVQQTGVADPAETDWAAVPDGTTLAVTTSGTGTLDPTSSCLTPGTSGATCQLVVHDAGVGTLTLAVTAIAATTVDGVAFANIPLSAPATASKTWSCRTSSCTRPTAARLRSSGGDPFNYTITVTNEGPLATSAAVTVTDTIGPGLEFAGTPSIPASTGSCAPPAGSTLTCTITASIAVGDTVTIVVPARVVAGTTGSVQNLVTVDSPEDPLCPNGECPPPPECVASATPATPTAAVTAGDASDNQACVLTPVTEASSVVTVPPVRRPAGYALAAGAHRTRRPARPPRRSARDRRVRPRHGDATAAGALAGLNLDVVSVSTPPPKSWPSRHRVRRATFCVD